MKVVAHALFKTYKNEVFIAIVLSVIAEVIAIFYTFFIRDIIIFLKDRDEAYYRGIYLVAIFGVSAFLSSMFRHFYLFYAFRTSIKIRKTLILTAYTKIIKLSMFSLTKVKSGRIINFVSSELYSIERGLTLIPMIFSSPIINIAGYLFIGFYVRWYYALFTFGLWLFVYISQYFVSKW